MSARLDLTRALRDLQTTPSWHRRIVAEKRVRDVVEQRKRHMTPDEMRDECEMSASHADFLVRERRRWRQ
jgi:hypothetical protein